MSDDQNRKQKGAKQRNQDSKSLEVSPPAAKSGEKINDKLSEHERANPEFT